MVVHLRRCLDRLSLSLGAGGNGLVLVIRGYRAYFDSSGGLDRPSVVVAGFVATLDRWKDLHARWDSLKDKHGIEYFHSVECEHGQKQFDKKIKPKWKNPKIRSDRRMEFVSAIADVGLPGFVIGVVAADYESLSETQKNKAGKPFSLLGQALVIQTRQWADKANVHERFPYLFEAGSDGYGQLSEVFRGAMQNEIRRNTYRMESIGQVGKECNAVQAADLLAYEHSHCMASRIEDNTKGFDRPAVIELRKKLKLYTQYFDLERLQDFL